MPPPLPAPAASLPETHVFPLIMAHIAAGAAILAGCATLIGWATGIEVLYRIRPDLAPMKPNTALCFILCGTALIMRIMERGRPARRGLAPAAGVLAAAAAALGIITLVEHITGWNPGIDLWMFGDALGADGLPNPGRMTPTASLNFALLGLALLLIDFEPWQGFLPAQHAALFAALLGLIGALGYLYGEESLYSFFAYSSMALHTTLTFMILGVGVMMARPDQGLMSVTTNSHSGGMLARRLLPAAILLPSAIGWLRLQGELAGWYDMRFGLALFASANIITFVTLLWFSARSLNRADSRRQRAHEALEVTARELRVANERLKAEVAEHFRTEQAKLRTERQLRQSQKMESLGTLAGGIAHDFNNILTAIFLNADKARKLVPEGHAALGNLAEIQRAGTRAADLVRRIMTFGRQAEPNLKTLRLREAVEDSLRLLSLSLPSNVTLETGLDADVPPVSADATQIHQILLNLGTNALQAMQKEGGTLSIKIEVVRVGATLAAQLGIMRAGRFVRLSVADTGPGMEKAVLDRIFDPFFTTKDPGTGTGLGLSVVHGIMELHGGCVTAYSEPGRGALFHLYFPAVEAAEEAVPVPATAVARGDGARILCIDDDEAVLSSCASMLEDLGYAVTAFTDARLAREEFRNKPRAFDVVLTDFTMPGLSGLDLARDLNALQSGRPGVPIILMSGYLSTTDSMLANGAGITAFVQKPCLPEELGQAIADALRPPRADGPRV